MAITGDIIPAPYLNVKSLQFIRFHLRVTVLDLQMHDDVIKWKHFPRYWSYERGIHRSPVNFPHNGQWRRALMFSLVCVWTNGWDNNRDAGDLRRHCAHYHVAVMVLRWPYTLKQAPYTSHAYTSIWYLQPSQSELIRYAANFEEKLA